MSEPWRRGLDAPSSYFPPRGVSAVYWESKNRTCKGEDTSSLQSAKGCFPLAHQACNYGPQRLEGVRRDPRGEDAGLERPGPCKRRCQSWPPGQQNFVSQRAGAGLGEVERAGGREGGRGEILRQGAGGGRREGGGLK